MSKWYFGIQRKKDLTARTENGTFPLWAKSATLGTTGLGSGLGRGDRNSCGFHLPYRPPACACVTCVCWEQLAQGLGGCQKRLSSLTFVLVKPFPDAPLGVFLPPRMSSSFPGLLQWEHPTAQDSPFFPLQTSMGFLSSFPLRPNVTAEILPLRMGEQLC